ncbi:concanavalin A-like lectin/glucanase domain-containing protein [Globomyces pollinis-pini]|nr:concanavalin A-like lectin/glucanase domain-containing protein [Globomyces pollinis-pini]
MFIPYSCVLFAASAFAQACQSGAIDFLGGVSIDYNAGNVQRTSDTVHASLTRVDGGPALGTRLSTYQSFLYGRFSMKVSALPVNGIVVTFITMSDRGDEIDFEFVGGDKNAVQSNVFYKGITDFGTRFQSHQIGDMTAMRTYTIDWTPQAIKWYTDGNLVRTYSIDDPLTVTEKTPPGEKSFPSTPSRIQFGIWDAGSGAPLTSKWAGGPIPWGSNDRYTAVFQSLTVECYGGSSSFISDNSESQKNATFLTPSPETNRIGSNMVRTGSIQQSNGFTVFSSFHWVLWVALFASAY